jgi:excisionase family DNA binding protein
LSDDPVQGSPEPARTFTIAEAASATGVTEKTIRRMVKAGTLPAVQKAIPGGFKYVIPQEALAHIAHEVGDRVLPSGVPSTPGQPMPGMGTRDAGYPGVPVGQGAIEDLRRDRDAWRQQAEEAQQALARLQEALSRQHATIDNLILRALPEPRLRQTEASEEPRRKRRGFWDWFWGR